MYSSRNISILPHGRLLEIPKGRGVLRAKLFKGNSEAKLDFPERSKPNNLPWGGYGYFLEEHNLMQSLIEKCRAEWKNALSDIIFACETKGEFDVTSSVT